MDYSIANGWNWINNEDAALLCSKLNLPPQQRLLLLSDGSLTNFLEALNQSPVDVEIKSRETRKMEKEEATYLEIGAVENAITRDVWLMQAGKKLVYARSIFPLHDLDRHFVERIAVGIEPIGKSLMGQGFLSSKDKLEICAVHCKDVNDALELAPQTILWAKHYRLIAQAGSAGKKITTSITEIFSPELAGNPPQKISL